MNLLQNVLPVLEHRVCRHVTAHKPRDHTAANCPYFYVENGDTKIDVEYVV